MVNLITFIYGSFQHNKNGYNVVSYSDGFEYARLSNLITTTLDSVGYYKENYNEDYFISAKINENYRIICKFNYSGIDYIGRKHCMTSLGVLIDKETFNNIKGDVEQLLLQISLTDINELSKNKLIPCISLGSGNQQLLESEKLLLKDKKKEMLDYLIALRLDNPVSFPIGSDYKKIILLLYKILPENIKWNVNITDYCNNRNTIKNFNLSCSLLNDSVMINNNHATKEAQDWATGLLDKIINPHIIKVSAGVKTPEVKIKWYRRLFSFLISKK